MWQICLNVFRRNYKEKGLTKHLTGKVNENISIFHCTKFITFMSGPALLKLKPTKIIKMLLGCEVATLVSGVSVAEHMYNQGSQGSCQPAET